MKKKKTHITAEAVALEHGVLVEVQVADTTLRLSLDDAQHLAWFVGATQRAMSEALDRLGSDTHRLLSEHRQRWEAMSPREAFSASIGVDPNNFAGMVAAALRAVDVMHAQADHEMWIYPTHEYELDAAVWFGWAEHLPHSEEDPYALGYRLTDAGTEVARISEQRQREKREQQDKILQRWGGVLARLNDDEQPF